MLQEMFSSDNFFDIVAENRQPRLAICQNFNYLYRLAGLKRPSLLFWQLVEKACLMSYHVKRLKVRKYVENWVLIQF